MSRQSRLSWLKSIVCDCHCCRSHSSYSCCGVINLTEASLDSSEIVATSPCVVSSSSEAMAPPPWDQKADTSARPSDRAHALGDDGQLLGQAGEHLVPAVRERHQILDAHAQLLRQVDARLDRDDVARA